MKTVMRTLAIVGALGVAFAAKPAQAQVSVGIATPGFALGVGPGAGYVGVGGGYFPGYPAVVPPPVYYGPRPGFYAPPVYARPYYGGYYGRGYVGRPGPGPGPRYYRR